MLLGFIDFYRVFTYFYWVLLGFTGFYWVLLGCTGFYRIELWFYFGTTGALNISGARWWWRVRCGGSVGSGDDAGWRRRRRRRRRLSAEPEIGPHVVHSTHPLALRSISSE